MDGDGGGMKENGWGMGGGWNGGWKGGWKIGDGWRVVGTFEGSGCVVVWVVGRGGCGD